MLCLYNQVNADSGHHWKSVIYLRKLPLFNISLKCIFEITLRGILLAPWCLLIIHRHFFLDWWFWVCFSLLPLFLTQLICAHRPPPSDLTDKSEKTIIEKTCCCLWLLAATHQLNRGEGPSHAWSGNNQHEGQCICTQPTGLLSQNVMTWEDWELHNVTNGMLPTS